MRPSSSQSAQPSPVTGVSASGSKSRGRRLSCTSPPSAPNCTRRRQSSRRSKARTPPSDVLTSVGVDS